MKLTRSLSSMSLAKKLLLGLVVLCSTVQSRLSLLSPMNLQSKFVGKELQKNYHSLMCVDGTIEASYANFGYIPYGHSIVRNLYFMKKIAYLLKP
jgi:hypothetical protein